MFKQISYKNYIIDIICMDEYVQGWLGAEGCPEYFVALVMAGVPHPPPKTIPQSSKSI